MRAVWIRVIVCYMLPMLTHCGTGTTPNIQQIVVGRCLEYQELSRGKLIEPRQDINCSRLWDLFEGAWTYKDPKTVSEADYKEFLDATEQPNTPENKILLWSGTFEIAHEYSNQGSRYVTLEDSLIGYLANGITWCGEKCAFCDGINHVTCPSFKDLPKSASQAFWGGASSKFAGSAKGTVTLMLNGTNPDRRAYSRESFFAQFELPSLRKDVSLRVILVNDLDTVPLEHCDNGSLLDLKADVEGRGLSYTCQENPLDVLHLLCVDSLSDKCRLARQPIIKINSNKENLQENDKNLLDILNR